MTRPLYLALIVALSVPGAWAKRTPPPQVVPVISAGVRYTAPNDDGKQARVEAWDVATGKKLWEQEIYRVHINPLLEEDVQWVFITALAVQDGQLLVTSERYGQYALDLKTRQVTRTPARPTTDQSHCLWEIGKADGRNTGFALAPSHYDQFAADGFYVVGHSNTQKDWPYVHPGPLDVWAGEREHTFTITFGVKQSVVEGMCRLNFDLLDSQYRSPPQLRIEINGQKFERQLPAGASDDSIRGQPGKGKPYQFAIPFPATLLKAGNNQVTITTISGSWFLYERVALETPTAVQLAAVPDPDKLPRPATARSVQVDHVFVVFKTHFDLGYTDLAENVFTKYRVTMMDGALKVIDENRNQPPEQRFVWTVAGWPLARAILDRETDPARHQRIEQAIKEGSLAVHALPGTLHTESFDLEDLVRGLHYSARLARDYGRPLPIAGKMTDVPEHSWVLPTVLANAGIKFMQIGCNSACQYPRFPRLFWWEGPDGSRILCNYTVDYGSGLRPPRDWPSRNYLAMVMTGDNHGPPTPQEVENVRKGIAQQLPDAKVTVGTLDDFAKAVIAENPDLPVVRGDTPDTWIHGLMSMPQATKIARTIRPLEPALDALDTHLKTYGLDTPPLAAVLADAYEGSFLYGEHTWGMNGEYGGRRIWPLAEWKKQLPADRQQKFLQSFEDHRNYIRNTQAIVQRELQSRLDLLAKSVNAEGARIVVWNSLPWPRSGTIDVAGRSYYVENVPPNGYKTISVGGPRSVVAAGDERTRQSASLQTAFYRATFDLTRGGIASLVEKATDRELVDKTNPYALGQFLHERFSKNEVDRFFTAYSRMPGGWALNDLGKPGMPGPGTRAPALDNVHVTAPGQPNPGAMAKPGIPASDEAPYLAISPDNWKVEATQSDVANVVTLTAGDTKGLAKTYRLTFTFPRQSPAVDVEWSVGDKTPDKLPEGGWLCFPFAINQPQFTLGRLGGPVDPAKDIIPGANRHLCAISTGVSITGTDKTGISLCPLDSPLVSLEKPGLWWWSMDFVPKTPTIFVNLYNNMWNTNFPLWQDGSWSERVRLWPSPDLVVPAWEARVPLLAAVADGPAGKLPKTQAGLSVSRPGVLVTAFGANPDGRGTLVRVWDQSGESGQLIVTLPGKFATATPVDLRGENAGAPTRIQDNKLAFNLGAYAPASYILE